MTNDLIHDQTAGIERLLEIMRRLRDPETGCPWDIEQTFDTIAPYTIEEAYEVADAIERRDWPELEGELGDLLLQSVYHTAMGEEDGHFTFQSVVRNISNKMVARHPHVFGDESRDKARDTLSHDEVTEEYGDMLFVMANLGRHLGVDPEEALRAANAKFTRRFEGVERRLKDMGKTPDQSDLAEMDALWDAEKAAEKALKAQ